jgi:hypothetical protein
MQLRIADQNLTIKYNSDLLKALKTLPDELADKLLQQFIEHPDFSKHTAFRYRFMELVNGLPARQHAIFISAILDDEHFHRIIVRAFHFSAIFKALPNQYQQAIFNKILSTTHSQLYLVKDMFDLIALLEWFNETDGSLLLNKILPLPQVLNIFIDHYYITDFRKRTSREHWNIFLKVITQDDGFIKLINTPRNLSGIINHLPASDADILMQRIFNNTYEFIRIFCNPNQDVYHYLEYFNSSYQKEIVQLITTINQESPLQVAVKSGLHYRIPKLLKFGADPAFTGFDANTVLEHHINHDNLFIFRYAHKLIKHGADPDTYDESSRTLLHRAIQFQLPNDITRLLEAGANPALTTSQGNNALDLFFLKFGMGVDNIDLAMQLVIHGAISHHSTKCGVNLLTIIYDKYPEMVDFVLSQGIYLSRLNDTFFVFKKIDMILFRLHLKTATEAHKAKNAFLNLCIMLGNNHGQMEKSPLHRLGIDILAYIGKLLCVDKSHLECTQLIKTCIDQRATIKTMAASPGGLNVMQVKKKHALPSFIFFKSVETMHLDYHLLKVRLKVNQPRKHPHWDNVVRKKFTLTSLQTLEVFKKQYAAQILTQHMILYKSPAVKKALVRNLEGSELLADIAESVIEHSP